MVEVTRSLSKIVKSSFVSFTEQKKEIKVILNNDPKILQSSVKAVDREIEEILEDNQENLEEIKHQVKQEAYEKGFELGQQEGYDEGYEKGYALGYAEGKKQSQEECMHKLEQERSVLHQEAEHLQEQMEKELAERTERLEPKMLHIIDALVQKLVGIQSVSQGTILHLIRSGMNELDLHGDLVIKVSAVDIDEVLEHKAKLTEGLSEKIDVEILLDQQLEKNECVIETNMGSIDCSLGTQMESLLQELRLIRDSLEGDGTNAGN